MRYTVAAVLLLVAIVLTLATVEAVRGRELAVGVLKTRAEQMTEVILATRQWSTCSGVYANRDVVEPNRYLDKENRDLDIGDTRLTKVNPAYMTRLISNIMNEKSGVRFRLVSDHPVNPVNALDGWEMDVWTRMAEKRQPEYGLADSPQGTVFRYLMPVVTEAGCLDCHKKHGYQVGDIRGGLSITIPAASTLFTLRTETIMTIFLYILLGSAGIFFVIHAFRRLLEVQGVLEANVKALNVEMERRKKSEAALVAQSRFASMGELLSTIAHHWRQPLCAIGLYVQNIEDEVKDVNAECSADISEQAQAAMSQVEKLSRTIDSFQSLFSAKSSAETFDARLIALETIMILMPQMQSVGIRLLVSCEACGTKTCTCQDFGYALTESARCDASPFMAVGDAVPFRHAVIALVKNGIEAIADAVETGKLNSQSEGCIHIRFVSDGETCTVIVTDNGSGVSPAVREKLFEPYVTTRRPDNGRGIGLFMARSVLRSFPGGDLRLEDDPHGTVFVITMTQPKKG